MKENLTKFKKRISDSKKWSNNGTNTESFKFDDITISVSWYCDVKWDHYSKSYRANGGIPKKDYSDHKIIIENKKTNKTKVYKIESFRGNYLLDPIRKFFKIKNSKSVDSIKINRLMRVKLKKKIGNYRIYDRTIGNIPYDFCIVNEIGVTFHDPNLKSLTNGLREKLGVSTHSNIKIYDIQLAKKLKFCNEGILDFIEYYNLDENRSYTKLELRKRVFNDPSCAIKYPNEIFKMKILTDSETELVKKYIDNGNINNQTELINLLNEG